MGEYREECLKRKAVQAGIVEQHPVSGKNGKARPSVVEYRLNPEHAFAKWGGGKNKWYKWKAYRSDAEAQRAMDTLLRKNPLLHQYRLRTEKEAPNV